MKIKTIILSLCVLFVASRLQAQEERIRRFHADITVDTNAVLTVVETISVVANSDEIRHGIYRVLPLRTSGKQKYKGTIYKLVSVKKNGSSVDYHTETTGDELRIYIGSATEWLFPGNYTYEITYHAYRQIRYFDDYDELYWNVNGTHWSFSADTVSATVHLPEGANVLQKACYTGTYGSRSSDCKDTLLAGNIIRWHSFDLRRNEGLTIAAGFPKGIVAFPPPPSFLEKFGFLILAFLTLFALVAYYVITWRRYGVDPKKPVVYPQFNVPEGLSPAVVGYLYAERYDSDFVAASLVNLAVKGYIRIRQQEEGFIGFFKNRTFTLTQLNDAFDGKSLSYEEQALMSELFRKKKTVKIDGSYDKRIERAVDRFHKLVTKRYSPMLKEGHNRKFLIYPFAVFLAFYVVCIMVGSYSDFEGFFNFLLALSVMLPFIFFGGAVAFLCITRVKKIRWVIGVIASAMLVANIYKVSKDPELIENLNRYVSALFFAVNALLFIAFQYFIKRPAVEKLRLQSLIEGLKMYISMAEEQQMRYFNPPQMTPEVFEELLPYAMVLGVDRIWGKKFQRMLDRSTVDQSSYRSSWYDGPDYMPAGLGHEFNTVLSNAIGHAATSPSSSSSSSSSSSWSSSSSGSGGGGFSGGGGGGGGGGGW